MRHTRALVAVPLLLLAACSTSQPGKPSPTNGGPADSPASSAPSAAPGSGQQPPGPVAPRVENPLDTTRFQQAPCDTLTPTQINELLGPGVKPKPDLKAPAGPACSWDTPNVEQTGVLVIFSTVTHNGLTDVYRARSAPGEFLLKLAPIDGYPIAAYGESDDRNTRGECDIAVGTSDTATMDIAVSQSKANIGKKDPCDAAHDIAAKILATIRGRN